MASRFYDRRYSVTVEFANGQGIKLSDLRCSFRVVKNITQFQQFGEVTIYNLSPSTETEIFNNARRVIVEAGYQSGAFGIIFDGSVRQPIRGKVDGVTYFITLHAIDGDEAMNLAFCNAYIGAGQLPEDIARQITRASDVPFDLRINGDLGTQKTERGRAIFGQPKDALHSIAQNNNAALYSNNGTVVISALSQGPPPVVPELNFQTGLIGTPKQQDQGVSCRCLINPDITIDSWVKLNNQTIQLQPTQFQQQLNPYVIDLDGVYRVIAITAIGDTRGNDWYYDLDLISRAGRVPLLSNSLGL